MIDDFCIKGYKMKVQSIKEGEFGKRHYTNKPTLCIGREGDTLYYFEEGVTTNKVRANSIAYTHNDFYPCDRYGNNIKGYKMAYKETTIIVLSNTNKKEAFANEDDALEWITEEMAKSPRTKYTMFKAYQTVEPKAISLADLIKEIK